MYSSPARARIDQQADQRSSVAVVITSVLALLVVVAAVGAVAWLVLRSPDSAVDSAERLEPVGTALPAPTEVAETPTPQPTNEPEPTSLAFTGDQLPAIALPTVASEPAVVEEPESAGPTPTPRIIEQPAAIPTVVPTLPPAPPVTAVPVVALQPVTQAPTPVPAAAPSRTTNQAPPVPTPRSTQPADDDPFNIFDTDRASQIVPVEQDPMERVREMQEKAGNDMPAIVMPTFPNQGNGNDDKDRDRGRDNGGTISPVLVPTITPGRDGSIEVQVPDVDAMIDEITSQATNPDRNPTSNGGRSVTPSDDKSEPSSGGTKRRSRKKTPTPRPSTAQEIIANMPVSNARGDRPNAPVAGNQGGDCPFANLPEDQRPDSPLWDC